MAALTDEEIKECLASKSPETKDFIFQQTMLRVKDPKKSLRFYSEVLGMRLVQILTFCHRSEFLLSLYSLMKCQIIFWLIFLYMSLF